MKLHVLLVSSLIFIVIFQNVSSWSGNVCNRLICGWRYEWRCVYRTWNACCGWRRVKVNYYYYQYFCCNGWTTSTYQNCNKAICTPPCGNGGQCTLPGQCKCTDGWTGYRCYGAAACSYNFPCYPGDCQGLSGTGSCVCSSDFSGNTCLTVQDELLKPTINRCNATFTYHDYQKYMDMYSYFGDATELDETYILWSNQQDFNILDMIMEVQYDTEYDGSQNLPDYVSNMTLGVISAKVDTEHFKLGPGGVESLENTETYPCDGLSSDNPISNQVIVCKMNGTNNFRVDSADRFVLTFSATAGGFRKLKNRQTNVVYSPQYYTEKTTSNKIEFKFDYESPIHCIEDSEPCSDKPLHVSQDITKNNITPRWDGWKDELSQVVRYSIEVWKMEYSKDFDYLREPLITPTTNPIPIFIREVNVTNTNTIQYPTFPPSEPGVYSCILEVSDNANNTRYARRFVLYDKTSKVTTQNDNPIKCTTASSSTGYTWQTNGDKTVELTWKDHFINTVHAGGHFLSPVGQYVARLYDGGRRTDYKNIENKFDDYEGKITRNGIDNVNGIVKFEFAFQAPSADVSNLNWMDLNLSETRTLTLPSSEDGFSQKFWVRARDIIGNTKEDTTIVSFDSSQPSIGDPVMEYNLKSGRYDFSSRLSFVSKDAHSGVPLVKLKIVTQSGEVKYEHRYSDADLIVSTSDCKNIGECYCSEADRSKCYMATLRLDIDNCWMGVDMNATTTEMHHLEITSYNGAMLYREKTISLETATSLSGIQMYYGVSNLQIEALSDTSFEVIWEESKSCYERLGMKLMVTNEDGHSQEHDVYMNATSYIVQNLKAPSTYIIYMFTKYGTDEYFVMSEPVNATINLVLSNRVNEDKDKNVVLIVILSVILSITLIIVSFVSLIICYKQGKLKCKPLKKSDETHNTLTTVSRSVQEAQRNRQSMKINDLNQSMPSVKMQLPQMLPKIGERIPETENKLFEIDLPTGRANALPPLNTKLP